MHNPTSVFFNVYILRTSLSYLSTVYRTKWSKRAKSSYSFQNAPTLAGSCAEGYGVRNFPDLPAHTKVLLPQSTVVCTRRPCRRQTSRLRALCRNCPSREFIVRTNRSPQVPQSAWPNTVENFSAVNGSDNRKIKNAKQAKNRRTVCMVDLSFGIRSILVVWKAKGV